MSWRIKNDALYETNGDVICTFASDLDPFYSRLIKKMPDIMSLFFEFRETYEAKKKISKKLFDKFCDLIEENQNYNFKWELDKDGDLIDNANRKICFFSDKESTDAVFIQFVPEILTAIKNHIAAFTSTDAKQKPLYESLSKILKRIDDY